MKSHIGINTYDTPNNIISDIIINFSYCEHTNKCKYDIENSYIVPNNSEKIIVYETKGERWPDEYLNWANIKFWEKKLVITVLRYTKMPHNYIINSNTDIVINKINISGFIEINECVSLTLGYVNADSYILFNCSGDIRNINGEIKSSHTITIIGKNINNYNGLITGNNLHIKATNVNNKNGSLWATHGIVIECENKLNNMLGLIESTNGTIYIELTGTYSVGIQNEIGRIKSFDTMNIIIGPNYKYPNYVKNKGGFIKSLAIIKIICMVIVNSYGVIDGSDILITAIDIESINGALISAKSINILVLNTYVNKNNVVSNYTSMNNIIITNDYNCNCNFIKMYPNMIKEDIIKKIVGEAIISCS